MTATSFGPCFERFAPARGQQQQRGGVGTARHGKDQNRMIGEIGEQGSEFGG